MTTFNLLKNRKLDVQTARGFSSVLSVCYRLFLYNRSQRVTVAFNVGKERFGGTEVEVHIKADGEVVKVIGHEEGDDFFFLIVHVFYERENQTPVSRSVFGRKVFFSPLPVAIEKRIFIPTL